MEVLYFLIQRQGNIFVLAPILIMKVAEVYNTDYGAIDLGTISPEGVVRTLMHFRGNGYGRIGLAEVSGASIRFNDFLRLAEGVSGATDTVLYSQNFWIDTDGFPHIKKLPRHSTRRRIGRCNKKISMVKLRI